MATTVEPKLPAIFFEACGEDDARFKLAKPFYKHGWIYSTDCRVVVRTAVTTDEAVAISGGSNRVYFATRGTTPNMRPTWGRFDRSLYVDQVAIPNGLRCFREIQAMDGGAVRLRSRVPVQLREDSPVPFMEFYLWFLRKHGVRSLWLRSGLSARKQAAWFEGDGFDGLLMPMERV